MLDRYLMVALLLAILFGGFVGAAIGLAFR